MAVKILKFDTVIDDVLNKLKKENNEYKKELINNVKGKQKHLKELLANYNDVKKKYFEFYK